MKKKKNETAIENPGVVDVLDGIVDAMIRVSKGNAIEGKIVVNVAEERPGFADIEVTIRRKESK